MTPIPYEACTVLLCPGRMAVNTLPEHSTTPRRIVSPSPRPMSGDGQDERGPPLQSCHKPSLPMCLFDHVGSQSYCSACTRFAPHREIPAIKHRCDMRTCLEDNANATNYP